MTFAGAAFLVVRSPAATAVDAAEAVPARATFGPPARVYRFCVYRFSGYVVDAWDVNLLTKCTNRPPETRQCSQSHMLEGHSDAAS